MKIKANKKSERQQKRDEREGGGDKKYLRTALTLTRQ